MNEHELLFEARRLLFQIALRSFMDGSKNFVKMPISLRNQVDEFLKKTQEIGIDDIPTDQRLTDME